MLPGPWNTRLYVNDKRQLNATNAGEEIHLIAVRGTARLYPAKHAAYVAGHPQGTGLPGIRFPFFPVYPCDDAGGKERPA